jgi:hypothetical protein
MPKDRWEFSYVDMLRHEYVLFTAKGLEMRKIKKDKTRDEDTKDDAAGRFVAELGVEGWELASGTADIRPVLFFRRKLTG